jgi:hypothetical protein
MKTIENNPYRLAGILSGASMKEITKAKKNIKLAKIGKKIPSEFDFSFFSEVSRTEESLNKAFSAIQLNEGKVKFSLFWFLKGNRFDETAINYLVQDDRNKALDIWGKVTSGRGLTSKNFSSFNNIGTLKLLGDKTYDIKEGIEIKLSLIESDCFTDFVHLVAGETFILDSTKQSEEFVDELLKEFKNRLSSSEIFDLFEDCNSSIQKYLSKKFTEEPLHNIESQVESTKNKRKSNKRKAYEIGLKLFNDCKDDLALLKSILGTSDLKYKIAADSLAKEVMQCGVDYFQEWNKDKDPSKEGLVLLRYAKSIAVGSQTKDRANENIKGLMEWVDGANERLVYSKISDDFDIITQQISIAIESYENYSTFKIRNQFLAADKLISETKEKIKSIKSKLGEEHDIYLKTSSEVAAIAIALIIKYVNSELQRCIYKANQGYDASGDASKCVSESIKLFNKISVLKMNPDIKAKYNEQKKSLDKLHNQYGNSSGCYIATMAYGDYDHPQVIQLRKFRDETLSKSYLGQLFIKIYYKYSPTLVEVLRNQKQVNTFIRTILNQIIKAIKK